MPESINGQKWKVYGERNLQELGDDTSEQINSEDSQKPTNDIER